jgi:hypothetical protein
VEKNNRTTGFKRKKENSHLSRFELSGFFAGWKGKTWPNGERHRKPLLRIAAHAATNANQPVLICPRALLFEGG